MAACVHHWVLQQSEEGTRGRVSGVCKRCHMERNFKSSWNEEANFREMNKIATQERKEKEEAA